MASVTVVLLLVVLATAVATGARHWRVPAPSLLVVAGLVAGLLPFVPEVRVAPDVISVVVLPPLLYASAEELSARELRPVWRPVAVLALGLVLASAAAVALVVSAFTPLSPAMAFVLGAVLASTDPVAVTALGRRLPLPPRIQVLVQGESLFNDATSLVLFKVAVTGAVAASAVSLPGAVGQFLLLGGGGAVVGGAVGALVGLIRRRTGDATLETVIALVTPYAAYVVAEDLHTSGVTAVVVAGVVLGSTGHRLTGPRARLQLHAVYGTVVFLLESVVFAIIGLQLPLMVRELTGSEGDWPLWMLACAGAVLAVRLLWIFPLSALTQVRRRRRAPAGAPPGGSGAPPGRAGAPPGESGGRLSWRVPAVLSWGGPRGGGGGGPARGEPRTPPPGGPPAVRPPGGVVRPGGGGGRAAGGGAGGAARAPPPRRDAAGRRPVHPAHHPRRGTAAVPPAGPGADHRGGRRDARRAGVHAVLRRTQVRGGPRARAHRARGGRGPARPGGGGPGGA
ncbi:cation:proton antiporter [Streptomyces sp. 8L]|uniref:cation:proton antiporter n=1 Tax=Streptomyces sp. 8L TaxID=2877242 RepID=UPI0027DF135B|nr:cation:proton antiporter [Streptomyces sp. 8L]